jgi:hypothetical protein
VSSLNAQLHFTVMSAFVSLGFGSQGAIKANLLQVVTIALSARTSELAQIALSRLGLGYLMTPDQVVSGWKAAQRVSICRQVVCLAQSRIHVGN